MKKTLTILCTILAILVAIDSWSQKKSSEKLKSYKSVRDRASRSETEQLLRDADDSKVSDPNQALNNVQEALAMSIAQGDLLNEGKCYVILGEINENIQEWRLAIDNYQRAYTKLSDGYAQTPEFRKTLAGLGQSYLKVGNYEESLKFFQEALEFAPQEEKDELRLNISDVYYQMERYDDALKAIGAEATDSTRGRNDSRFQNQLAKIYARKNQLDRTLGLYSNSINSQRARQVPGQQNDQSFAVTKEEISDALKKQNRKDDEIILRKESYQFNIESANLAEAAKDKVQLSKTYSSMGENKTALKEIEQAFTLTDTLKDPGVRAFTLLTLAEEYERNGKTKQALTAYKKYSQAVAESDSLEQISLRERSNLIKRQKDIEEFSSDVSLGQQEESLERATVDRQQLIIYGLLVIILIIVITSYFIFKSAQASKTANQLLALKSLRGQMNPHFIFNALNSVNHFISQQDERTANKFLSEFSQLMRLVLENSQEDFIPLQKEQEILSLYLKLEQYRFRDKFDYEINIGSEVNLETIEVPPMLIQPYIENAVWHGLRYRDSKGKLTLNMSKNNGSLVVEISDNGIGRKKSAELKTDNQKKHNSTGLKNIEERLTILNKVYRVHYKVTINDLAGESGTQVRIELPDRNHA